MIVYNNYEWDVREASACRVKYGVSFKEATTVLEAEGVSLTEDPASGACRAVGPTSRGQVLTVVYKRGQRIRILDAVPAKLAKSAPAPAAETAEPAPPSPPAEPKAPESQRRVKASAVAAAEAPAPAKTPVIAASEESAAAPPASETAPVREAVSQPPVSDSPPSGWDAATYEIYWNAYTAARKAAREQGKSPREAQRIGKDAGDRAVQAVASTPVRTSEPAPSPAAEEAAPKSDRAQKSDGPTSDPAPKSSRRTNSWRAAARSAKPVS